MRLLGLATIVLALAAASCGGDGDRLSAEEYEQTLRSLPGLVSEGACELPFPVDAVEARRAAAAEQAAALDAIEPPEEAEEAHAELVAVHRDHEAALAAALEEMRELPDPREAETRDAQAHASAQGFAIAEAAAPDVARLAGAQRALAEAGYEIEPPPLEPDEYEERVNGLVEAISPIAVPDARTTADLQAEAERLGLALVDAAARIGAIEPPAPVSEAHEHLALGICTRAQELLLFAGFSGVDADEPAPTAELRSVIATLDPFFEEAAGDYRDRGYEVAVPEVAPAG